MKLPVITEIKSMDEFKEILSKKNKKMTIIKLGAKWCQPCKRIEPLVYRWMDNIPDTIQICLIDVDISFNLYSFLKSKRIVNGIPALLSYETKSDTSPYPDDVVIGGDLQQVQLFFERCLKRLDYLG